MEDLQSLTVGQVLERGAAQVPDKTAVVDGSLRKTYDELNRTTDALAAALADIGLQKGDRAAIYMKNSFELMVAFYALQKLGVIAVWVNSIYRRNESEFILNNSGARAVFIFSEWEGHDYLNDALNINPLIKSRFTRSPPGDTVKKAVKTGHMGPYPANGKFGSRKIRFGIALSAVNDGPAFHAAQRRI